MTAPPRRQVGAARPCAPAGAHFRHAGLRPSSFQPRAPAAPSLTPTGSEQLRGRRAPCRPRVSCARLRARFPRSPRRPLRRALWQKGRRLPGAQSCAGSWRMLGRALAPVSPSVSRLSSAPWARARCGVTGSAVAMAPASPTNQEVLPSKVYSQPALRSVLGVWPHSCSLQGPRCDVMTQRWGEGGLAQGQGAEGQRKQDVC